MRGRNIHETRGFYTEPPQGFPWSVLFDISYLGWDVAKMVVGLPFREWYVLDGSEESPVVEPVDENRGWRTQPDPCVSANRLVGFEPDACGRVQTGRFRDAESDWNNEPILTTWTDDPSEWTWIPLHPQWSPDGKRIAFYSNRGSYIADIKGNDPVRVSESPGYYSFSSSD